MKVFITGATSGLGKALSAYYAAKNFPLFITASHHEHLEQLSQELSSSTNIAFFKADLSNEKERKRLIEHLGNFSPDLVINNAGYGIYGDCLSTSLEDQIQLLQVNAQAVLEITLQAAKFMKKQGIPGTILNISSSAAFFAFPGMNVYSAAKTFVNQFSQSLDIELEGTGIRVLTACPGQIDTPFSKRASKGIYTQPSSHAMSVEKVVRILLWQLKKKKRLHILDWRYKMAVFLGKLLPVAWLGRHLRKNILARSAPVK